MFFNELIQKAKTLNERLPRKLNVFNENTEKESGAVEYLKTGLKITLDNPTIYSNVALGNDDNKSMFDLVVVYDRKVFLIKTIEGMNTVFEENSQFFEEDENGKINRIRNPFEEARRQANILRNEYSLRIRELVYFYNVKRIEIENRTWFSDIEKISSYIREEGHRSRERHIIEMESNLKPFDVIKGGLFKKNRYLGIIEDDSLDFVSMDGPLSKKDIERIDIAHEMFKDHLSIKLKNGKMEYIDVDNRKIKVNHSNVKEEYQLSQIDSIIIG